MISSNANLTRDRPLSLALPVVASTAALAFLIISSTSASPMWCDAKNTTFGVIGRWRNKKNPEDVVENSTNNATSVSSTSPYDYNNAIYHELGVRLPHNATKVLKPGFGIEFPLARWSWKIHGKLLPLLHIFDYGRPDDVFVNLRVLWCKLLISLDPRSVAYEGRMASRQRIRQNEKNSCQNSNTCIYDTGYNMYLYSTYRMLPPYSIKWALRYLGLWRLFPRWMHANIELRIVYLQTALEKVLASRQKAGDVSIDAERICVVILGGGYDPRGARLSAKVERVYELDLPVVVDSKRQLLLRAGFDVIDNRNNTHSDGNDCDPASDGRRKGVRLEGVDLNDDVAVDGVLDKIRQELISDASALSTGKCQWHVVLVSEAVLLYVDTGKAERILTGVSERFRSETCKDNQDNCFSGASFVFADRLLPRKTSTNGTAKTAARGRMSLPLSPDLIESEESEVRRWLRDNGWELNDLFLKPGATRHLGIATTVSAN